MTQPDESTEVEATPEGDGEMGASGEHADADEAAAEQAEAGE